MSRRYARESLLSLMYEFSIAGEAGYDTLNVMGDVLTVELSKADKQYINRIYTQFLDQHQKLDEMISSNLTSWNIERLSRLDLSILRLALVEMINADDIPDKVSINEAVELAKKFSTDKAPKFINGVLAGCIKQLREEKKE